MSSETLKCSECGSTEVTHVLVDYDHEVVVPEQYFCRWHAFSDGREMCSCCENFSGNTVSVWPDDEDEEIELKRTYSNGILDDKGMCSCHP